MKTSGFRKQSAQEIKEKQNKTTARRIASLKEKQAKAKKLPPKPKKPAKRTTGRIKTISTPVPKWIKAIPESSAHGSGTYQKRLWKLTSDYVRIRDFYKYGTCAATGKHFEDWKGTNIQAGHLKPYSTCNGLFKFDVRNIHAQDGYNNKFGNYDDFRNFEKEVRRRGYDWDLFETESNANNGCRMYDSEIIEQIEILLHTMSKLKEQPPYYERAVSLLEEHKELIA